ncbi:Protein SCO1 1, mitochondrial [Dionaea muscipula]
MIPQPIHRGFCVSDLTFCLRREWRRFMAAAAVAARKISRSRLSPINRWGPPMIFSSSSSSWLSSELCCCETPNQLFDMGARVGRGLSYSMVRSLYYRHLCTNTAAAQAAAATSSSLAVNSLASQANSNEGNKSEESAAGGDAGKPVRGGPVSWLSFFLVLATGSGLVYYYDREKKKHIEGINDASNVVKERPSVGKAAIGGPFNLINHDGKNVSDRDFFGRWTLLYFGFTHCPDICPDELQKMAAAVDKIKEKSGFEIVPLFISVDPERDTVEQVHDYVKEFHPTLIGLTGHPDEIRKVAHAYRVYYMKTEEEGSDYLVDHSIVMYLMSPEMEFVKFFGKNNDADALADGVIREIKLHKK